MYQYNQVKSFSTIFSKFILSRRYLDNSMDVTPHLVKAGHKLPECSRGMQVDRVGITMRERLTTTTTTTTTTTSAPEVLYEGNALNDPGQ